ncbi:hypothetical protein [Phocaeicola abscessus]|uniref:hypothetical protein n=1 Tax=Phocaeicola abscessus TaxID=555313 RepID=UPI0028EBDA30|nr:hypothetical protein [Phocaeicola abscessus]
MNKKRTEPLIPPLSGRWARVGLSVLFSATVAVGTQAQTADRGGTQPPRDQNSELHTRTWSIYAQGGLSWANDVWYQNLDAKRSYQQSPTVGGGIDFTIRPWVRVGAEYLWSRYRREQWLNIWVGTGAGYTFAKGNEYGIYISNTQTQGGQTTPIGDGTTIGNDSEITVTGNVRTTNHHEKFNTLYVPASLHIEADVSRRFTVGLKGEMDWLMNRKDIAPKNLILALATVRYNFVASRAKVQRAYYKGELSALNDRVNALQRDVATEKARAEREAAERQRAEQQQAELQRRLTDCEERQAEPPATVQPSHFVQFAHNSSYMSREEAEHLKAFARSVRGHRLTLVAEASTPGADGYNQQLSGRRLARVVEALVKEGFDRADLNPQTAIGERNGKPAAEGRRVTIKVEK